MPLMVVETPGRLMAKLNASVGVSAPCGDHFARSSHAFHPEYSHAALRGHRQYLPLEAAIAVVERVQRHLYGVEGKSAIEHCEMDGGIFVPRETNEANFALLLGCGERLEHAIRRIAFFRIVVVHHLVNLPYIEVIGLQASQRLLQHLHGDIFLTAMGTDLGHHDRFVALALECSAQGALRWRPCDTPTRCRRS